MRVGILVVAGPERWAPEDVLRAEYLAAAARAARHVPVCGLFSYPVDPGHFAGFLEEQRPHLLVYYATTDNSEQVSRLTDLAYRSNPDRPQFLVGPWTTLSPEAAEIAGPINGLLRGECDATFGMLLEGLGDRERLKRVPGIHLRRPAGPTHVVPLGPVVRMDELPAPDFLGFDWNALAAEFHGRVPMEASRGSSRPSLFHHSADLRACYADPRAFDRVRSPSDVVRDIQTLRTRVEPRRIDFVDEFFPNDPEWLRRFTGIYAREVGLPFSASLAPDLHDEAALDTLVEAGLRGARLLVETGDEVLRAQFVGRDLGNERMIRFARALEQRGCSIELEIFAGLPGESSEQLERTLAFLEQLPEASVLPRAFVPARGTALYEACRIKGLIRRGDRLGTRDALARDQQLTLQIGQQIERIFRLNLERSVRRCPSHRGYFSFVERVATAKHRIRHLGDIGVAMHEEEPAMTMSVPAESSFECFLQPETEFFASVALLSPLGEAAKRGGRVQVDVQFQPRDGGSMQIFSAKLDFEGRRSRVDIHTRVPVTETTQGTMVFAARDAGGGDSLTVVWSDPVFDRPAARKPDSAPRQTPAPSTPKPVPKFDLGDLEVDVSEGRRPAIDPADRPGQALRRRHDTSSGELRALLSNSAPEEEPASAPPTPPRRKESPPPRRPATPAPRPSAERSAAPGDLGAQLVALMTELAEKDAAMADLQAKLDEKRALIEEQSEVIQEQMRELLMLRSRNRTPLDTNV